MIYKHNRTLFLIINEIIRTSYELMLLCQRSELETALQSEAGAISQVHMLKMRQISRLDELLTDFALTPDGQSLLAIKGEIVSPYGFDMIVSRDVYVFDAETLRERALARAEQVDQLWFRGFSPDGRYAYVHGASAQWVEGSGWRDWRTTWYLLDLNSYSLILAGESGRGYLPIVP